MKLRLGPGRNWIAQLLAMVMAFSVACSSAAPAPTASTGPGAATAPQTPRRGGILKVAVAGEPGSLDIHQETSIFSVEPLAPAYNGLVTYDPLNPEKIIGDLAERYEISPDGLTYTFFLQKNVKWHDGKPFTSEDARFSFERMRKPPQGTLSVRSPELVNVASITAPDDYTLKITMNQPYVAFLAQIATDWFVIMPKHVIEAKGSMKNDVVGTGPFKFKSYTQGVSIEMVRNPEYFKPDRPYLDGITYLIIKDAGTRVAALRTGQAQMSGRIFANLSASEAQQLQRDNANMQIVKAPGLGSPWLHFNAERKPYSDVRVRQAIAMAFDRRAAIEVLAEGAAKLGTYVPPGEWGFTDAELSQIPGFRQPKTTDITEAKRLLAEAGYPNGFTTTILCRDTVVRACEFWQAQLKQLNITSTIDVKESAPLVPLQNEGAYDLLVNLSAFRLNDPDEIGRKWVTKAPQNYARYSNPVIDQMNDQARGALDPANRRKIVHEMDKILLNDAPDIMPYWEDALMAVSNDVKAPVPAGQYALLKLEGIWFTK